MARSRTASDLAPCPPFSRTSADTCGLLLPGRRRLPPLFVRVACFFAI